MNITIIGKNSSVYNFIRSSLLKDFDIDELRSTESLHYLLNAPNRLEQKIIIFSGIISQDKEELEAVESFHNSLIEKISKIKNARAILISSSAVYGTYKSVFSESDDCLPTSNYGLSKAKIEQMYLRELNQNVAILRLGNVLGLDTVGKAFSDIRESDRYLDCRNDLTTPMRTYVDFQILSDLISSYIENFEDLPQILNVGREKPQAMHNAAMEMGMNFRYKITENILKDLTLDTSQLFKILHGKGN